jgi:hypothetical protein
MGVAMPIGDHFRLLGYRVDTTRRTKSHASVLCINSIRGLRICSLEAACHVFEKRVGVSPGQLGLVGGHAELAGEDGIASDHIVT